MSKDRYSDNHTFEVIGEDNKINIKDNLEVDNDITAGNDVIAEGQVKTNEIAPESGTTTTVTQNLTVTNNLRVEDNLFVTLDADINGDLAVDGKISAADGFEGPRTILGPVQIFHTFGIANTGTSDEITINLSAYGFQSTDVIYGINLMLGESTTPTTLFPASYQVGATDTRYNYIYQFATQDITVYLTGADWLDNTNIAWYVVIWYEET